MFDRELLCNWWVRSTGTMDPGDNGDFPVRLTALTCEVSATLRSVRIGLNRSISSWYQRIKYTIYLVSGEKNPNIKPPLVLSNESQKDHVLNAAGHPYA